MNLYIVNNIFNIIEALILIVFVVICFMFFDKFAYFMGEEDKKLLNDCHCNKCNGEMVFVKEESDTIFFKTSLYRCKDCGHELKLHYDNSKH